MSKSQKGFSQLYLLLLIFCFTVIPAYLFAQNVSEPSLMPLERLSPNSSFYGELHMGRLGYYLSPAGDVNGDGFDDFLVAGYHHHVHGWNSGGVYLFLGKSYIDWGLNMMVGDAASALFCGKHEYDFVGYNVDGGGDFNGDGLSDFVIGAPGNWDRVPPFPGKAYIVLGKTEADWGMDFVLEDGADEDFLGQSNLDQLGYAVGFVEDMNKDGYDEILCSAAFKDLQYSWQGKVYLIPGSAEGYPKGSDVVDAAVASFTYPADEAIVGSAVCGAGDVNNDGIPDFAIGASGIGTVFLLFGRTEMDWGEEFDLHDADVTFLPENPGEDDSGWQVKGVSDVNGDQIDDFLISGLQINNDAGKTYLIFGREDWSMSHYHLSQADASYLGEGSTQHSGVSIAGINDFDGDGYNDFMIGARYYSGGKYHRGKAYIVKGKSGGWQRNVPLSGIETYFVGEDTIHCAGWGVSSAGDINADGRPDILTSAPFNSENKKWAGEVYLFLGNYTVLSVNGYVNHFNEKPIPNATVTLSHTNTYQTKTETTGEFQIQVVPCDGVTIDAHKEKNEDVGSAAITAYDAALTARFAVGLESLSTFQQLAADVSGDGEVQCYDAALIAHHAVGMNLVPSSKTGNWFFEPPSHYFDYLYSDKENVNFTGGIMGDVDGNWNTGGSITKANQETKQALIPDLIHVKHQEIFALPIQIKNYNSVISADIEIEYPSDLLNFVGVEKSGFSSDFQIIHHDDSKGNVKIALYGLEAVNWIDELVHVQFQVVNRTFTGSSKLCVKCFRVNDSESIWDESTLVINAHEKQTPYVEIKNVPNPFNPSTTVHFKNSSAGEGTVMIFDMLGRKVREFHLGNIEPGEHKIQWDGRNENGNELPSGVFFIRFKCGENSVLNKMIKIK